MTTLHLAATLFMGGLIWTIQLVHYPLFVRVGEEQFVAYEASHTRRMGALLVVPALVEIASAALLTRTGGPLALAGAVLLVVIWTLTAVVFVPLHGRLSKGRSVAATVARLVRLNWVRTALWSVRGVIAVALL